MKENLVTWEGLAQMMRSALLALGERDLPLDAERWIETLPIEVLLETEKACSEFLRNGDWLHGITSETRMLLRLRCLFVLDCIISNISRGEPLQSGTAEPRMFIYFGPQWLRDWRGWLAQRNQDGCWNFPFDPWEI
jgi:hypothetical protein